MQSLDKAWKYLVVVVWEVSFANLVSCAFGIVFKVGKSVSFKTNLNDTWTNIAHAMGSLLSTCSRGEREFPFPVIPKNGGLWFPSRISGMDFFHSLPVPEFREWIFFIPFPFPNFGNGIFSFPSHSRNLGMDFFIPFPFPNFGNGLFQFPSRSRTLKSHSRSPLPPTSLKDTLLVKEITVCTSAVEIVFTAYRTYITKMLPWMATKYESLC